MLPLKYCTLRRLIQHDFFTIFSHIMMSGHPLRIYQKQPFRGVLMKGYPKNVQQIYWRKHMPKCNFSNLKLQSNFIEVTLRHRCSPVKLKQIFRAPFLKNTSDRLLLLFLIRSHASLTSY